MTVGPKIKQLLSENKFDELHVALIDSDNDLKIHLVLLQILDGKDFTKKDYGFGADKYQEEFLEGLDLYKILKKSSVSYRYLLEYKFALVSLASKMGGFIKLMSDTATQKGVYLSQIENVYKVNPILRNELQSFIDLLSEMDDLYGTLFVAEAKALISLSTGDLLDKAAIGQDMLQLALMHEKLIGKQGDLAKNRAIQTYINILNDFECESASLSSGLFPEITHVDTRTAEEIEVYETAKERLQVISNEVWPEVKRVHADTDTQAKALVEEIFNNEVQPDYDNQPKENTGFWRKLKRRFS